MAMSSSHSAIPQRWPPEKSTRNIPIVIGAAGDPVATGLVHGVALPAPAGYISPA